MSRKIHIGYIVLRMDVGGVERSITRLLDGLPKDRYRMTVICLDRSGKAMEWVENKEVQVIELHKSPGWDFRAIGKLAEMIQSQQIDIIQSHNWGTLFESVWANRSRFARHIHAERGTVLGPPSKSRIKTMLKARLMRHAIGRVDLVMSNSYATADKVRKTTGLADLRVEVIPNGLVHPYSESPQTDPGWNTVREKTRSELGVGPSDLLIGVVGRLSPVKNFELALSGFAAFLKATRSPDGMEVPSEASMASGSPRRFLMVLVGDGPCRESLEKLARELGISDSVEFVGEKKDAWPYYAAMDIFMSTSHSEGMSQSILEAMASGKAIIATDVGDARRMLDSDHCGRTLGDSSVLALRTALVELSACVQVRQQIAANAVERFQNLYSLSSMLDRFDGMYQRLINEVDSRKSNATVAHE
jgi:glycosyltransferase involved in cell wall biosynthesis